MEIACCFFGHREIYENIGKSLYEEVCSIIEKYNVNTFYVGENGDFDSAGIGAVLKAKNRYKKIKLYLVIPYFSNKLNNFKEYYETTFDDVIFPDVLNGVHFKSAIYKRNKWMIDKCSYVIVYIQRDFGGAYNALKYAEKNNKTIINIKEKP